MINKVIETNAVLKCYDSQNGPYHLKLLDETHLEEMLQLKDIVVKRLPEWDMLLPVPAGMLLEDLGRRGLTLGAFVRDRLVGFRSVHFPKDGEDNLGRDVGMPDSELVKVMQLEVALVHPDFRGDSLQKRLTTRLLQIIRKLNLDYRYLCSWVSPKNSPSLADKFAHHMLIARVMLKCEKYWRCIFFQDALEPLQLSHHNAIRVFNRDVDRMVELTSQGYFGFSLVRNGEQCDILFAKCLDENRLAAWTRR